MGLQLTRICPVCSFSTTSLGSFGASGMPGIFFVPMHAGRETADSEPHRPLMRKEMVDSYSMPSSRPVATVSQAGSGIAEPPQRYQFWLPTRRNLTVVDLAPSGSSHLIFILPSVVGSIMGTSVLGLWWRTNCMPLTSACGFATGSLGDENSLNPSAFRKHMEATYSTPSEALTTFASVRVATKVVLPLPAGTSLPLEASTSRVMPEEESVIWTWAASTGGHASGMDHVIFSFPAPRAVRTGGSGFAGFALGLSSPILTGMLGCEMSLHPSLFMIATMAS
mmetsp:Transcript_110773/g.320095  ORF Transcript_110773/g.320095 Transcript_110773/m.320095 type:complete len:280 (-) Transcript_110773:313-1152(-)